MRIAAGDDGRQREDDGDEQRQRITGRRNTAREALRNHDRDADDDGRDRAPGEARDPFAKQDPAHQSSKQRHAGAKQHDIGDGCIGNGDDEGGRGDGEAEPDGNARPAHVLEQCQRAARSVAHQHEGQRNRPANRQRQKTIVQLSGISRKRAMAPPKLQKKAEPKTSRAPSFSLAANGAEVADGSVMANCPGAEAQ